MMSLTTQRCKRSKENGQLKEYEPNTVTCEYHRDSAKTAWSNANALNFLIKSLRLESDQNGGIVENKTTGPEWCGLC